ncbi:hypothetical protein [Streptomyces nodosus]|uniref:hypothetical protein n=1 Tax=Streptomyces nodosus TaxID=40318 RepID=UPI00383039D0
MQPTDFPPHALHDFALHDRALPADGEHGALIGSVTRGAIARRQLRGSLPQGFMHALLLGSTARLAHDPGS